MDLHEIDASRRSQRRFAWFWTAFLAATLLAFRAVLVPFVTGALIAYVLAPLVDWLETRRIAGRSPPRWSVVLGVYLGIVGGLFLGVTVGGPVVARESVAFLRQEAPRIVAEARSRWLPSLRTWSERTIAQLGLGAPETTPAARAPESPDPDDDRSVAVGPPREEALADRSLHLVDDGAGGYRIVIPTRGLAFEQTTPRTWTLMAEPTHESARTDLMGTSQALERLQRLSEGRLDDAWRAARGVVGSVVGGIFGFFLTLMLSAYMLLTRDRILAFVRSLAPPDTRAAFDELLSRMDRGLSGVVRGQLLICAVNGVLSAIGFAVLKLSYWPLLALVATVLSIIPIFGAILSSVPAVAVGLHQGFGTALLTLGWILLIHQIEANLLNPKIMGDAARIHPVLVVFSLLAGERFFGILGALLAVPAMSLVQSVFLHWRKHALNYGESAIAIDSMSPSSVAPPPPRERS